MKNIVILPVCAALLSACSMNIGNIFGGPSGRVGDASSTGEMGVYKTALAQRIASANARQLNPERPQALLRAVIVLRYQVDGDGNLLRAEIARSNGDRAAESIAMNSLYNSQPFPRPSAGLMRYGRVELSETWLFNDDGRFQLRSIAQSQLSE